MTDLLFKNARLIDPSRNVNTMGELGVHDGCFAEPSTLVSPEIIDLKGKILAPGFIDVHVHLRDPGQTYKEDMATGTAAAANGGFTTVLAMPNTVPAADSPEIIRQIMELAKEKAVVNVLQSGCLTMGRQGLELTDAAALKKAGCPVLTDDGSTPQNTEVMEAVMTAAAKADITVIDHCEKYAFSKPGVMHLGRISRKMGLPGQSRMAEIAIVRRDIALAAMTGCRIHLQHISCRGTVSLLKKAQERGIPVTAEVTPHHLFLTDESCLKYGTNAKMAPPVREEADRQALLEALCSGLIKVIATDHAPHTEEEKGRGWEKAPFGIVGIECVVPLCLTNLVARGLMSMEKMVYAFTAGPAELIRSDRGTLQYGRPADITVIDPDKKHIIDIRQFKSKGVNCPWDGYECIGNVDSVYIGGNKVK